MERRLSGKVMPTIKASDNVVDIFESISKMNLNKEQKSLLFVTTQLCDQLCDSVDKKAIIIELEKIKDRGYIYPKESFNELINKNIQDLSSSDLSHLSESLIELLNKNESENIF